MAPFDLEYLIRVLPGIIVGLTVHEFAHAFVAQKLGDDTATRMGRASLNPLKHIDPLGFIFIVVAGFGWAKPVLIDRTKLQSPRRDDALIASAGPLSNLVLGFIGVLVLTALLRIAPYEGNAVYEWFLNAVLAGVYVNLGLFVFNAIPLPPLDGSHVLLSALDMQESPSAAHFFRYGTIALFGIIIAEQVLKINILPLGAAVRFLADGLFGLAGFGGR